MENKKISVHYQVGCSALLCFMSRYWGINVRSRGFLTSEPRGHAPTIQNRRRETSTRLPQTTWGGQILTLHLNYVAGYTGPLLFLFEQTQQLTPLTTRGKPWRPRVWAGPMFVRTHRWGVTWTRTGKTIWTTKDRFTYSGSGNGRWNCVRDGSRKRVQQVMWFHRILDHLIYMQRNLTSHRPCERKQQLNAARDPRKQF